MGLRESFSARVRAQFGRPHDTVRASYDRLAAAYTQHVAGELAHKPFDRALLDALAAELRETGPVGDVGCGPGHVTSYLRGRDVDAHGIDLSPEMIAVARNRQPGAPFDVGDVTALDLPAGAWAGAVAFYSLIHLPRDRMPVAFHELYRVLRAGAPLLLAFHVGEEVRHIESLWDIPVDLAFVFFTMNEMETYARAAGFVVEWRAERDPYAEIEAQTRRGYLRARVPLA